MAARRARQRIAVVTRQPNTRLVVVFGRDGRIDHVETEDGRHVLGVVDARLGNVPNEPPELQLTVKRPRVRMES